MTRSRFKKGKMGFLKLRFACIGFFLKSISQIPLMWRKHLPRQQYRTNRIWFQSYLSEVLTSWIWKVRRLNFHWFSTFHSAPHHGTDPLHPHSKGLEKNKLNQFMSYHCGVSITQWVEIIFEGEISYFLVVLKLLSFLIRMYHKVLNWMYICSKNLMFKHKFSLRK